MLRNRRQFLFVKRFWTSQVSLSRGVRFVRFLTLIFAHLLQLFNRVCFLLMAPVGSSAPVELRAATLVNGSSLYHLTTPSNWNLRYFVYLMKAGLVKLRSGSMTEKEVIPYWEFLLGQDSPSSYKQVVGSWCSLYKKIITPLVTLRELL